MMRGTSPTGRIIATEPQLQQLPLPTPEAQRVIRAFRTPVQTSSASSLKAKVQHDFQG